MRKYYLLDGIDLPVEFTYSNGVIYQIRQGKNQIFSSFIYYEPVWLLEE